MPRFWRKKSKPIAERTAEYHKEFADRIIKQIKEGVAPWQKPWKPGQKFLPANFKSGKSYRGTNTLNLASVAIERGYSDHRWGTYKQIKAAGGQVRRGERGTSIVYFKTHRSKAIKDNQGKPVKDKDGMQVYERVPVKPFPKHYVVFNVEQADRLKLPELPEAKPSWEAHDAADRVIRGTKVDFSHERGDRAVYEPDRDRVVIPPRDQFPDAGSYYRTALHEVGHATGHPKRMDRESLKDAISDGFGSQSYAKEELRAEISSMMTNTELGIGHESRHGAAYVASWVDVLEEHPKEIARAASEAQAMSAYMIEKGRERGEKDKDQAKAAAADSREPEIQYEKTGPERFEYRQGERTAVVDRPTADAGDSRYLVTMQTSERDGHLTRWAKDSDQAHQFAQQYATRGDVPTWSESHHDATGARHQPTTDQYEKTGPERFEYRQGERTGVQQLRQAGIECQPAENGGWQCTEISQREYLGTFSSPTEAAKTLTGRGAGRPQVIRKADSTAIIEPPRVGGWRSYYRVAMGKDGWRGSVEARAENAKDAEALARQFTENGETPRGSHYRDQHIDEVGRAANREQQPTRPTSPGVPTPERTGSQGRDRDDEPSR